MLTRALSMLLGVAGFIVAAFFFSVLFLVGAALVLALWGWLAWNTRHLRRQADSAPAGGHVIDGEFRVEEGRAAPPAVTAEPEAPRREPPRHD